MQLVEASAHASEHDHAPPQHIFQMELNLQMETLLPRSLFRPIQVKILIEHQHHHRTIARPK
eukprot:259549-Prorocentrum_lima.AAC.1